MRKLFGLALGAGMVLSNSPVAAECNTPSCAVNPGRIERLGQVIRQIAEDRERLDEIEESLIAPGYALLVTSPSGVHSVSMTSKERCHEAIKMMIDAEHPDRWRHDDLKDEQRANLVIDGKLYHVRDTGFTCLPK